MVCRPSALHWADGPTTRPGQVGTTWADVAVKKIHRLDPTTAKRKRVGLRAADGGGLSVLASTMPRKRWTAAESTCDERVVVVIIINNNLFFIIFIITSLFILEQV